MFQIEKLGDLICPGDLIKAKFPGSKNFIYSLWEREDFPGFRHGKKLFIAKSAFVRWLEQGK